MHMDLRARVHVRIYGVAANRPLHSALPGKTLRRASIGLLAGRDVNQELKVIDVILASKEDLVVFFALHKPPHQTLELLIGGIIQIKYGTALGVINDRSISIDHFRHAC